MLNIICSISVVAGLFWVKTDVKGIIISKSESNYLVDFSKETKRLGYEGDYSEVIIEKNKCIELKGSK